MSLPTPEEKRVAVERMFDRIAPRYDGMNRLMTLGMDRTWRRRAIDALALRPGDRVLDLGCGTGDLAAAAGAAGAAAIGLDVAAGMLRIAAGRTPQVAGRTPQVAWMRGEGERLPLRTATIDAIVSGFALRNLSDLHTVLDECARVLRPSGRLVLLEVDEPRAALLRLGHRLYFRGWVPLLGRVLADRDAYRYLPDSVAYLPDEHSMTALLSAAGFAAVEKTRLLGGAAQILSARRS